MKDFNENRLAQLLFLARELNDSTTGNSCISMDWGNARIECYDTEVKELVKDLGIHYRQLLEEVKELKKSVFQWEI